jgi:unsaturated rhamnogalacturonyl hydrolase
MTLRTRNIAFALLLTAASVLPARAQNEIPATLHRISTWVTQHTSFQCVDTISGAMLSPREVGKLRTSIKIASDYNDWTYFNGVLLLGLQRVSQAAGETELAEFVRRDFDFIFTLLPYFNDQWEVLQVKRASYYRVFRMNMLDDCGTMGAALIDAYAERRDARYLRMIQKIANYIGNVALRLDDGTLARPDPRYMTVWADDLTMSVPFLVRMGNLTGEQRYIDDACRQITGFVGRLREPETGLLKHAWFSDTRSASVAAWGRANGWAVLAQVELLRSLPPTHPLRDSLEHSFREHLVAVCKYQDPCGLWHQVLDHPESYLETSCSAMFCYGLAYASRNGLLDASYAERAHRAWNAVAARVRPDGQIEGICRGTEVGFDLKFYYDRATPINDPRGIGAVLLAGSEMMYLKRL